MGMGRPLKGLDNVDEIEGSEAAKLRLKTILGTLSGEIGIEEACEILSVSRSRIFALRKAMLEGALDSLEPGKPGRKAAVRDERDERIDQLERQMEKLEIDLEVARVRTELALTIPETITCEADLAEEKKRNAKNQKARKMKRQREREARKQSRRK